MLAVVGAVRDKKRRSPLLEISRVLVHLNHVGRFIVNADHGIM
jgi:hypothetical protein